MESRCDTLNLHIFHVIRTNIVCSMMKVHDYNGAITEAIMLNINGI